MNINQLLKKISSLVVKLIQGIILLILSIFWFTSILFPETDKQGAYRNEELIKKYTR